MSRLTSLHAIRQGKRAWLPEGLSMVLCTVEFASCKQVIKIIFFKNKRGAAWGQISNFTSQHNQVHFLKQPTTRGCTAARSTMTEINKRKEWKVRPARKRVKTGVTHKCTQIHTNWTFDCFFGWSQLIRVSTVAILVMTHCTDCALLVCLNNRNLSG